MSGDHFGESFSICEECQGHKDRKELGAIFDWSGERYQPCNCKEADR